MSKLQIFITMVEKNCPENETFSCGNPHCEETCQTIGKPCTVNIFRCEDLCYCDKGLVRTQSRSGNCVEPTKC